MIDAAPMTIWAAFNDYKFYEAEHKYFYKDKPVKTSVTQFVSTFFEPFDSEKISAKYAAKHKRDQQEVLAEWEKAGKVSATAGTIIHKYMEDGARGKVFDIDYSAAEKLGILKEVQERVELLLPQAKAFQQDTFNKLIPIQLEYTVGIEDVIAGNIDALVWNVKAQEYQIWDYKNLKEMTVLNNYGQKAKGEFEGYDDCHLVHYSIQQNLYKVMLERKLGIKIGGCYLVHFSHLTNDYEVYPCIDLADKCGQALDRLVRETRTNE